MRLFLLLTFCLSLSSLGLAAQTIEGSVRDIATGEVLPFVSIQKIGSSSGTFSDFDGNFWISASPGDSLRFSYVGYADQVIGLAERAVIEVGLRPQVATLAEVVVRSGENPAWRIIRAALANRSRHDPQQYAGYQYQGYRKTVLRVDTLVEEQTLAIEKRSSRQSAAKRSRDSLRRSLFLNDMHLWLTETVSTHYFRAPNQHKEDILASQSSMPADLTEGINPIAFQPFGFYRPRIRLEFTRQDYVNPLSTGCLRHYDYQLLDTLYQGADTTFIISFAPLSGKYFVALEGVLYINSDGYAIENVIAEPADTNQLLDFRIRQQSQRLAGRWFPEVLDTELRFRLGRGGTFIQYNFGNRTYIKAAQLEVPATDVFNQYRVERPSEVATLTDSLRPELLSRREVNTYQYWDSLAVLRGPKRFLHGYNQLLGALASGVWGRGKLQVVVLDLLRINPYEGVRPGIGLRTGPKFAERWSAYTYAGYGLRDRRWKYHLALEGQLLKQHDLRLRLSHGRRLAVPGQLRWLEAINNPWSDFSVQDLSRNQLDEVTHWRGEGIWRPHRAWQLNPFYAVETRRPLYAYTFAENGQTYRTQTAGLRLRWSPREQLAQMGDWEAVLFPNFPIVDLMLSQQSTAAVARPWWRVALRVQQEFRWSYLGNTQVHLQAGAVNRSVPFPYLFQTEGGTFFFLNNSLQTAGLTEFTNQYYGYLFFTHRFGQLLGRFRNPRSRPELSLLHNLAWGRLPEPGPHTGLELRDLRHLFLESGLRVDNIIRIPYFQLCYIGLGGSAFYRWGAYHLPEWRNNWVFQLSLLLSV